MKLLLDSCVWGKADGLLIAAGHDVSAVKNWPRDPGDDEVLRHASRSERVVVTLDKDFGELSVLRGFRHHGIIRLVDIPAMRQPTAVLSVIALHANVLARGGIVTVEPGRVRVREPSQ